MWRSGSFDFYIFLLCSKKNRLEKIRPCKHEPSNQSMKESTLIIGISLVLRSYNIEYNSFHSDCVSINLSTGAVAVIMVLMMMKKRKADDNTDTFMTEEAGLWWSIHSCVSLSFY